MFMSGAADCPRMTIDIGNFRYYDAPKTLYNTLEMILRLLYLATTRIVSLPLPSFRIGLSTNRRRSEAARVAAQHKRRTGEIDSYPTRCQGDQLPSRKNCGDLMN
jgi:hypothetical protein